MPIRTGSRLDQLLALRERLNHEIESKGCVRKPEKADWRALADAQTARHPDPGVTA